MWKGIFFNWLVSCLKVELVTFGVELVTFGVELISRLSFGLELAFWTVSNRSRTKHGSMEREALENAIKEEEADLMIFCVKR